MKRLFVIIFSIILTLTAIALSACSSKPQANSPELETGCDHSHGTMLEWNATKHWRRCWHCPEKFQEGEHTLNDESKCTVCNVEVLKREDSILVNIYDKQGNIIQTEEYDIDGHLNNTKKYDVIDGENRLSYYRQINEDGSWFGNLYDKHGNVTHVTVYKEGSIAMEGSYTYSQNSKGEWCKTYATENYSDGTKIREEYDENGFIITRAVYDVDGNRISNGVWRRRYDDNGFMIQVIGTVRDVDGNRISVEEWRYKYDDNGFVISESGTVSAYDNEVVVKQTSYRTTTDGGEIRKYVYMERIYNEDKSETVYSYDENGKIIRKIIYNKDRSYTDYSYNENGEIVSETKYDTKGYLIK